MIPREGPPLAERHIAEFNPGALKVIVFDVDETLVHGTTAVKDRVWTDILFPERKDEIHQVNRMFDRLEPFSNGEFYQGDRLDRIAYMLDLWTADDASYREHPDVIRLAKNFEHHVQEGVRAQRVSDRDKQALQYLKNKMQLHVVSNVPEDVLRANLVHYGIVDCFTTIVGTPVKKPEALQQIMNSHNCVAEELLMVGDGNTDYDAAKTVGTQFMGIVANDSNHWTDTSFPQAQSISVLQQLVS